MPGACAAVPLPCHFSIGIPLQPCHVVSSILSRVSATKPDVKVITFNHEGIFNKTEIDRSVVKAFVDGRNDMDYPIYIDSHRVAVQGTGACCLASSGAD